MPTAFHDLSAATPAGKTFAFSEFQGKVVLIVNTATKCGLTPQFDGLEALHQKYRAEGLAVIGFPCNQFAFQEPTKDADMEAVCRINHGVTFPLMAKSDVNGSKTNPTFAWLKDKTGGEGDGKITWNFTKFLVSRDGAIVKRYEPTVVPADMEADLVALLKS